MLPLKLEKELNEIISKRNELIDITLEKLRQPITKENLSKVKDILIKAKLATYPYYSDKPTEGIINFLKNCDQRDLKYGLVKKTDPHEFMIKIANEYNKHIQEKLAPLYRRFDDVFRMIDLIMQSNSDKELEKGTVKTEKLKPKVSLRQIALKFVYEGEQITRKNGDEIVKQYGYKSGEKLFQFFTFYSSTANRKGDPETKKKLSNKIELIQSVIPLLSNEQKIRAKDDLSVLKTILENKY